MSDAGFATEKWLLENCRYLQSDVLVCGRHRSDYSLLPEFVAAVSPHALITSNASFPSGEVFTEKQRADLKRRGIWVFDQSETGAVEITISEIRLRLDAYRGGQSKVFESHSH